MATARRRGKTDSFLVTSYQGYTDDGRQVKRTTTFRAPPGSSPAKQQKLADAFTHEWEMKIRGAVCLNENQKFSQLFDWYFTQIAPNTVKQTTLQCNKVNLEKHVMPALGHLKIKDITPQALDLLFQELHANGNISEHFRLKVGVLDDTITQKWLSQQTGIAPSTIANAVHRGCRRVTAERIAAALERSVKDIFDDVSPKQGLSGTTVHKCKIDLSAIFTAATRKGLISRNPCLLATTPPKDTPKAAYLTEQQALALLNACALQNDRQFEMLVTLLLATGLRVGEATALHWDGVNFQTGVLHVGYTLANINGAFVRQPPKTTSSDRFIKLPDFALQLLREHKLRQGGGDIVFTNAHGGYLHRNQLSAKLKKVLATAGLPSDVHIHTLRHTNASLLINANISAKVVADALGHATVKTTDDVYSHVFAETRARNAQAVEMALFSGK
jgi:integrase